MGGTASFAATVRAYGNNTGIVVPPEVLEQLGAGARPAVHVDLGGHTFRTTLGVMGGTTLLSVSAALRRQTGLAGGDAVHVTLTVADTPREVVVPDDLARALDAEPQVRAFFDALSNSLQRFHVDSVEGAKTEATRQRRVDKAVSLFLEGRKR